MRGPWRAVLAVVLAAAPTFSEEPTPTATEESDWSFTASGAWYFLPDDEDYLQPTFRAERGSLVLQSRYNYEDRESMSFFAGYRFEMGKRVQLALTPMMGGVVGRTKGIIPALEADLTAGPLELYAEAEQVFDFEDRTSNFFYMWSELSLWPTEWLRAGLVTQRTRVYETERDIQRGLLVGVSWRSVEAAFYLFNPDGDDRFAVASIAVSF